MLNRFKDVSANISNKDFIWLAEYLNGTLLFEYNLENDIQNDFYAIDKNQLLRFGLIGHGMRLYHETFNGTFNINGSTYDFLYIDENGKEYPLTNQNCLCSDIIQFKESSSIMNTRDMINGRNIGMNRVESYNFGYKNKLTINGIEFSVKFIVKIPYNKPAYISVKIVANKDLQGKLMVVKNGFQKFEYHAPIKAGYGGEVDWVVR